MKLFFGKFSWKVLQGEFLFLGGGGSVRCHDSSYLSEFLCFLEVLGIATKFRFHENQVIIAKTR